MKRKRRNMRLSIITSIFVVIGVLSGCTRVGNKAISKSSNVIGSKRNDIKVQDSPKENSAAVPVKKYEDIKISAVGDILVHDSQLLSQYDSKTGEYDFTNNFKFIKEYIQSADIAIANFETTLGGSGKKYTGYPVFNSPDAIADALKDTGFDMLTTANNHIIDSGAEGVIRTGEVLRNKGFDVIGTKRNKEDKGYLIKDVKGVKIGFTNYTFETPRKGSSKTINSIPVPKEVEPLIDTFNYENINNDLKGMKERISKMKADGAEFIVFCMHWGEEYQRQPNSFQKKIAQSLADMGVDIVLGGHPHVLEPIDVIRSQVSNKNTLVVYSLGNFLSNQCFERLNNRYPEDGMIVNIEIRKDLEKNIVTIDNVSYIPTWVHREPRGGEMFVYEILPLADALQDKVKYNLNTEQSIWRAQNSENNTVSLIDPQASRIAGLPIIHEKTAAVVNTK